MFETTNLLSDIEIFCQKKNIDYIDGVVYWCETYNVEIDYVADVIKKDSVFKLKIQSEAENLNVLKRGNRLPL